MRSSDSSGFSNAAWEKTVPPPVSVPLDARRKSIQRWSILQNEANIRCIINVLKKRELLEDFESLWSQSQNTVEKLLARPPNTGRQESPAFQD